MKLKTGEQRSDPIGASKALTNTQPYVWQADSNNFEVGNLVAAQMNSLVSDERCKTSKEECAKPVQEALEEIASDKKFYERK